MGQWGQRVGESCEGMGGKERQERGDDFWGFFGERDPSSWGAFQRGGIAGEEE